MRALCGAIIAAGAMIGLGLTVIGYGFRYQSYPYHNANGDPQSILFRTLDSALVYSFVVLSLMLLVGLGIAFLGLAFHHYRRHHEHLHNQELLKRGERPATTTESRITV